MAYAWIIDRDHLAEEDEHPEPPGTNGNAVGIIGPSDAPHWMCDVLKRAGSAPLNHPTPVETFRFRMYDDDGELYYTGRMITDEGDTEAACFGPLDDYGMPNAGCTSIRYQGHSEMDCG